MKEKRNKISMPIALLGLSYLEDWKAFLFKPQQTLCIFLFQEKNLCIVAEDK